MFSDTTILIINFACMGVMVLMMAIMAGATRMKGGAGWAAVILVTTTVPAYLSNLTRDLGADSFLLCSYLGLTLNLVCFPATWFFTRRQLDRSFRLTLRSLPHAIPAVVSLIAVIVYYAPMSPAEVGADMAFMEGGGENLPSVINDILLFGQFFAYFTAIFIYCRKRLRFLRNNYSDSDYTEIRWTPRFLAAFFILFLGAFTGYMINPRVDIWLFPILTTICVIYLVYIVLFHSTDAYLNRLPDAPERTNENGVATPAMNDRQMKGICGKVTEYLQSSKAYTAPGFSIHRLAGETGIHQRNISIAINGYLNKSFYDLVNEMRIEEAKRLLLELNSGYTIDSVYPDCGFRSRSAFFAVFKKIAGITPTQWLKKNGHVV